MQKPVIFVKKYLKINIFLKKLLEDLKMSLLNFNFVMI